MSFENTYQKLYFGICVFVTIVLTVWCVYEYTLDSEVSNIMLRQLHERPDDIQPSITLCDEDPFKMTKFSGKGLGDEQFLKSYRNYIIGQEFFDFTELIPKIQSTDYDDISTGLSDILEHFSLEVLSSMETTFSVDYDLVENSLVAKQNISRYLTIESLNVGMISKLKSLETIPVYISTRNGNHKCFTFDIPWIKGIPIKLVKLEMNATEAAGNSGNIDLARYYVMLTYPNQTLQASRGKRIYLNTHDRRGTCYRFKVTTGAMEVYHRRDKSEERCNVDWKQQDEKFMNYIIEKSGCNPKHWKIQSNYQYCNSTKQYQMITKRFHEIGAFMPPCRSIELLSTETKGVDAGWLRCPPGTKYLKLEFQLDKEMFYKEITEVKAYTLQSLIGNAGTL